MKTKILLIFCLMVFASFGLISSLSMSMMGDSHNSSCPFSLVAQGDCNPYNADATIVHSLSVTRLFSYTTLDFFKGFSIIAFLFAFLLYFLKVFLFSNSPPPNNFQNNVLVYQNARILQLKKIRHWFSLRYIRDHYAQKQAHEVFAMY